MNPFAHLLQLADQYVGEVAPLSVDEGLRKYPVDLIGFEKVPLKNQGLPFGTLRPKGNRVQAAGLVVAHTIVRFGDHNGQLVPLPGYRFAASLADRLGRPWYSPFAKDTYAADGDGVNVNGLWTRTEIDRAEFGTDGYTIFLLSEDATDLDVAAHAPPRAVGQDPTEYLQSSSNVFISFNRWGDPAVLFNRIAEMAKAAKVPVGSSFRLTLVAWFEDITEVHKPGYATGLVAVHPVAVRLFWSPLSRPNGGQFVGRMLQNRQSLGSLLSARGLQHQAQRQQQPKRPQAQTRPQSQSQPQPQRPQPKPQPQQPQYDVFEAYCGLRLHLGANHPKGVLDIEDAIFYRSQLSPAALAAMRKEVESSGWAPDDLVAIWRQALARFEAACMPDPVPPEPPVSPQPTGGIEELLAAAAEMQTCDVPDEDVAVDDAVGGGSVFTPGAFDPHEWGLKPQDLILNVSSEAVEDDADEGDDNVLW